MTSRAPDTTPADGAEPDPRRWKALVVCLSAGFLALLDVSIVNVALPSIEAGLGASDADLQRVLTGYTLAFGLVLVAAGRAGDALRRRRVFLAGLGVFTVGSLLCAVAPSAELLGAARVVQGVGGGLLQPQVAGFIQQLFRGAERGRAFGFFGATVGVSTAVGPLLGGVLLAVVPGQDAWRAVFAVNLPVAVVVLVLALRYLPAGENESGGSLVSRLDPVGTLLLGGGVVLLLLPLVQESSGSLSGRPWWLLAPGAALVAVFVAWERRLDRRGAAQLVDLSLFRRRSYAVGAAISLTYFAGFTAIFFVLTLTLQSGLGYSPLVAGLAVTPFAVGGFFGPLLGGRLVERAGRGVVLAGLLLSVTGLAATALVALNVDDGSLGWWTALPLLVAGFGNGLTISPNQTVTLSQVPVRQAGSAAGVLQTGQRVGSALGIAVVGTVFFTALAASDGDWTGSLAHGLLAIVVIVCAALALAVVDLVVSRRRGES